MIRHTYGQIRHPEFNQVMQKIARAKAPVRVAKRIHDVLDQIDKAQEESDRINKPLADEWLEQAPGAPQGMAQLKMISSAEERADVEKLFETFNAVVVEINMPRLTADELRFVEFTPADIRHVHGLVELE